MPPLRQAFARMRTAFHADMAPALAVRRDRLARVARMTRRHARDIIAAISADFGHRSPHETLIADLLAVDEAIKHARRHLAGWMRPQRIATALMYRPGYNRLLAQPLGVVGVVAPWNYPYQLSMLPAVAALAAGNRVMIKPSELAPRTAELMARIVRESFGEDELAVFPGDAAVGKAFVELPFDHLFFTGLDRRRPHRGAGGGEEPDAGDARARRKIAGDRRRRRRVRVDRAEDRDRQAVQCRPDLHRAGLRAGAPRPRRRIRRGDDARDRQALPDARRQPPTTRASSTSGTTRASRACSPTPGRAARASSRSTRPARRSIPPRASWRPR